MGASSAARRTYLTESTFEGKIAKIMSKRGIFSYHVSEKAYMGIPDRYVAGGRWIEFKQVAVVRDTTPLRFLRPSQQKFIQRFEDAGDKPYICILFQFSREEPLAIMWRWPEFKTKAANKWTLDYLREVGYKEEDWEQMVGDALG